MKYRKLLLLLAMVLITAVNEGNAQIFVRVRPERPHYERVVAPSPRHVWIDEEWEIRGGKYVFVGGRWVEPPHARMIWVPGHWRNRPRGLVWVPGHWK